MSTATTSIAWTDRTWNPIRGCSRVSPGCDSCYAMGQAHRFSGPGKAFHGLTVIRNDRVDWTGEARFIPEALAEPLSWRTPSLVFVNSMSDLFHHSITNEEIAAVFGVMAASPRHVFQVLTKRAERMREWFEWAGVQEHRGIVSPDAFAQQRALDAVGSRFPLHAVKGTLRSFPWPLANVWLGVSVEDQQRADERIPELLATPAAVRFISAEPLLGPLQIEDYLSGEYAPHDAGGVMAEELGPRLDLVIVGGESGVKARRFDAEWARDLVEQCWEAKVPAFVKQVGANVWDRNDVGFDGETENEWPEGTESETVGEDPNRRYQGAPLRIFLRDKKGADPAEWPEGLRVQQLPPIPFERKKPDTGPPEERFRILWRGLGIWSVDARGPGQAVALAAEATGRPAAELEAHREDSAAVALARAGRVSVWEARRDATSGGTP